MSPACHFPQRWPSLTTSFCERDNLLEAPTAITGTAKHSMETQQTCPTRSKAEQRSVKDLLNAPYDRSH
jgi:hypothetical protein